MANICRGDRAEENVREFEEAAATLSPSKAVELFVMLSFYVRDNMEAMQSALSLCFMNFLIRKANFTEEYL